MGRTKVRGGVLADVLLMRKEEGEANPAVFISKRRPRTTMIILPERAHPKTIAARS